MARDSDYSPAPLTPLEQQVADVMGYRSPEEYRYRVQRAAERQAAIAWLSTLTGLTPRQVETALTRRAEESAT